jgi:hypothetical protein
MEAVNTLTDLTLFVFLLLAVVIGWTTGYYKGLITGYNYAKSEEIDKYPVANVYFYDTDKEDEYSFVNMVTGEFITSGSFNECIEKLKSKDTSKLVVFSKGEKDEQ